jgi:hypothetical protein
MAETYHARKARIARQAREWRANLDKPLPPRRPRMVRPGLRFRNKQGGRDTRLNTGPAA